MLDDLALEELRSLGEVKSYRAGSTLFTPGEKAHALYLVLSGTVRVYALSYEGREITYWYCRRGDFVGMTEVWGRTDRRVFAAARTDSSVLAFRADGMERVIAARPDVAATLLRQLSLRLRNARDTMLALVASSARARLARVLLLLSRVESAPNEWQLAESYTQLELANLTGISRQTASELLAAFQREGLIGIRRRRIALSNISAITAAAAQT